MHSHWFQCRHVICVRPGPHVKLVTLKWRGVFMNFDGSRRTCTYKIDVMTHINIIMFSNRHIPHSITWTDNIISWTSMFLDVNFAISVFSPQPDSKLCWRDIGMTLIRHRSQRIDFKPISMQRFFFCCKGRGFNGSVKWVSRDSCCVQIAFSPFY